MKGLSFYFYLRDKLLTNDIIGQSLNGKKYVFVKWGLEGELIFISSGINKKIPAEMIIMSCFVKSKGIEIDYEWVKNNGRNEYCIHPVLNKLLNDFAS